MPIATARPGVQKANEVAGFWDRLFSRSDDEKDE
jgi:hypothetical protein